MKLISNDTDLSGMDCHLHSRFSPDAKKCGADTPQHIAEAVRKKGLRGFIVTDHIDIGHWTDSKPIDFDEYFETWERVRKNNPDLTIFIGLEIGYEKEHEQENAELVKDLPIEYIINSVHYWHPNDGFKSGHIQSFTSYLKCVSASLDAPYPFNTVGHLGFPERYAPSQDMIIDYDTFRPLLDEIIRKALDRGVRFEENTNAGGAMRLPRADFLREYKSRGGARPVLGSDAHISDSIGQHFDKAEKFLDGIFGKRDAQANIV